ncbi:helix-turn-helix transcriptional regulator [Lacrimispora indolis]|uniref:helix-turn-helix transcriptional regulator n=1 Tax=Lacrimispora indolis TaxID=69825 RepID=UPI00045EA42D|nr:YafY family protein [Lacrimispora indolis]MBE7719897.1 YafY family transcriptional regulator [Lacrimispora celerecrescens]
MKSNRMFGILCILLEKEKVTAKELADYFEVSVRTIHRDLLDISSAGFPVVSRQGIGGGVSLLPDFKYSKTALNKEDMSAILAGIQGLASIDDSAKIKTLLAKLRFSHEDKMLLEHDIIIDFTSWNHNSTITEKIRTIRTAIAGHRLLEMEYYGGSGYHPRVIEPYKLIFKQENWYLFGYCKYKEDFRIFKVNRMTSLHLSEETFDEREDYTIPPLKSDFSNDGGMAVTVRMDKSLEFLAVDFFGTENIRKENNDIFVSFQTERPDWVVSTFAGFGSRAEIISPDTLRDEMKIFLREAQKQYET